MPDLKITQLTADASPTVDDLLVLVNDPAGTPGTRRSTVGAVVALADGGGALLATLTASNSASLDFATRNAPGKSGALFQSDYDEYLISLINFQPATDATQPRMRFSTNGGSTYDSTSNIYYMSRWNWGPSGSGQQGNFDHLGLIHPSLVLPNSGNYGFDASLRVTAPLSTTFYKQIFGKTTYRDTQPFFYAEEFSGWYLSITAVNAFQVYSSSGNLSVGTGRVYGIVK